MIKHFAADGTVKREWAEGLHASARFERNGKQFVEVAKSNAIETVEVMDGEQVGETFVQSIASALAAADVHPIEAALSASALPPVAIAPEPEPSDIVMGTGPDAKPVIETELGELVQPVEFASISPLHVPITTAPGSVIPVHPAIPESITAHNVPLPYEVIATAAHALSDAAEVLKQEEERQAIASAAAQAEHSAEAAQIPTSEATNG